MTSQYKACAMTAEFENGARLAFVRVPSAPGQVFVIVGNASWQSLQLGQSYLLNVKLNRKRLKLPGVVIGSFDSKAMRFSIPQDQYAKLFAGSDGYFEVGYEQTKVISYARQRGDVDALYATGRCLQGLSDPFAK